MALETRPTFRTTMSKVWVRVGELAYPMGISPNPNTDTSSIWPGSKVMGWPSFIFRVKCFSVAVICLARTISAARGMKILGWGTLVDWACVLILILHYRLDDMDGVGNIWDALGGAAAAAHAG